MRKIRPHVTVRHTIEPASTPKLIGHNSGPDIDGLDGPNEALDWNAAVRVATARLNEGWLMPRRKYHPVTAELIEELAAFLCAYGLLAEEVRRPARVDIPPVASRAPREVPNASMWSEPPEFHIAAETD